MNFIEAIKLARQGKIMGYKTNGSSRKYIYKNKYILVERPDVDVEDDYITYLSTHGEYSSTTDYLVGVDTTHLEDVYIEDILRDDWEIYEEKTKLHTFEEAIAALKTGKKIMRASSESQFWSHKPEGNRSPMITRLHPGLGIVDNSFLTEDIFANDWIIKERN